MIKKESSFHTSIGLSSYKQLIGFQFRIQLKELLYSGTVFSGRACVCALVVQVIRVGESDTHRRFDV